MTCNSLVLATLLLGSYSVTASPSLPAPSDARQTRIAYYPPAEPNYPAMNPYPKSAALPASDKEAALLDAFNQRMRSRGDARASSGDMSPKRSSTRRSLSSPTRRGSPPERETPLMVRSSAAMHPDNFLPHNKRILPEGPMPQDAFVISSQPQEQWVMKPQERQLSLGPITNPPAYFLQGANLNQVTKPQCTMSGCEGPLPNDGSIRFSLPHKPSHSCYQTFVPLNECVGDRGYPVGMVCTICCDCPASFVAEMKNSRGYKIGFIRK